MTTGMAKIIIEIPEKYALEVSSPAPIRSERYHEEYLWVLNKLISKAKQSKAKHREWHILTSLPADFPSSSQSSIQET